MTRLAPAAVLLVLLAPPAAAAEPFAPPDGRFRVEFPGRPKETTTETRSALGRLSVYTATYALDGGRVLMVSYTDFPEGTAKPGQEAGVLDGVRKGLKGEEGDVLKDDEKSPRRELLVKKGDRHIRVVAVLDGDRLFQVKAVGPPAFVGGKDAAAFLKSFAVTK